MKMRRLFAMMVMALTLGITSQAFAGGSRDRVAELKQQILEISHAAQGEYDGDDNSADVRAQLDPLVAELVSLVPARTETEKLPQVVGSWQQVWADGPGGGIPGAGALANAVFQVVFPDGYYWNVAKNKIAGVEAMGFLRGKFAIDTDKLNIEFTKSVGSPNWVAAGRESYLLAMRAEVGSYDKIPTPGPIGKKGFLANTYVDEDIRICTGGGADFGTGTYLYVLERKSQF
ncbi:PAP/fibrillin family protein [Bdellovibrio sp. HCB185ZH]|uniref:PAP/fibrillin family protein n=1 Tax=Bdellovibrio sp. HCB185ZH TaxID=3394235 RepID=UPI0039A51D2F